MLSDFAGLPFVAIEYHPRVTETFLATLTSTYSDVIPAPDLSTKFLKMKRCHLLAFPSQPGPSYSQSPLAGISIQIATDPFFYTNCSISIASREKRLLLLLLKKHHSDTLVTFFYFESRLCSSYGLTQSHGELSPSVFVHNVRVFHRVNLR